MRQHAPTLLALCAVATLSLAGPIHTWSVGEVITASDLNAALSHIHNTMVGGHGPRLTNTDVSSGAAIAHSKLATPALVPKVWAFVNCTSVASTCSISAGSGATVAYSSTGVSVVTFTARANLNFGAVVSSQDSSAGVLCAVTTHTTVSATVSCTTSNTDGGVTDRASNSDYTIIVMDDNN